MFARFIHRPVLAIVMSIVIVFLGILSIESLPVSQFPEIAPPRVIVSLAFPGASAKVLVNSTIILLEQAINGVQGMRYMISDSTSAGEATIQVLFNPGVDPSYAIVQVKVRVDQIMNRLPPLVQLEGVIVQPVQPSMLMYVNLYSTDKNADEKFLYNYANVFLLPELKRITGIGQARILGSRQYAMRIWLNPDRMRAYQISTEDVMRAIADQSIIAHPGRIGQSSGITAQSLEYVLVYPGRFNQPEQYENIILRAVPDGETLYLKDVAKIDLASEFYDIYSNVDGYPAASIMFKQTQGSNASVVIEQIKAKLESLRPNFPTGMDYKVSYDVSTFLEASIHKVLHTLLEAFVLVALVVFIFLGDWRSTLIPTIAVPVSLIGAFFFMKSFGLTINLITLFALVLAIGVVVDDAIVVVEAVHAKMAEKHLSPYAAVKAVLGEISGAVIAITLLMTAVFVPVTFMKGPVGVFYRQFSITMASSIVLSGLVALTLTPVLSAMILKGHQKHPNASAKNTHRSRPVRLFNHYFVKVSHRYADLFEQTLFRRLLIFGMMAALSVGVYFFLNQIILSCIVVLTLTPALSAMTLEGHQLQKIQKLLSGKAPISRLIKLFNPHYVKISNKYAGLFKRIATRQLLTFGMMAALGVSAFLLNKIVLSVLVAFMLTPLLSSMILKVHQHRKAPDASIHISRLIDSFNNRFEKVSHKYVELLGRTANRKLLTWGIIAAFGVGIFFLNKIVPPGFIPNEDQGMIYAIIQTPPGSTLEKTNDVARKLQDVAKEVEGVDSVTSLAGYEVLTEGRGSNAGTCLISLKNWSQRKHSVLEIIDELEQKSKDFGAIIEYFEPPAVPGFSAAGGISFRLLDRTGTIDYKRFEQVNSEFMTNLKMRKELTGLFTFYSANFPQYELKLDTKVALQKGLSIKKAMEDLNILIGSTYEQGFIRFGQFFKVYVQALPEFRRLPSDILNLYTKNEQGDMVPFSSFVSMEQTQGPNEITRYNVYTSSAIKAVPAHGYTTGDAIEAVRKVARESLPKGYDVAWEGLSYDEALRGNEAAVIFLVVLAFVYLVLAAQYESFILPLAVIFSLPPGIFGSYLLIRVMGLANDIYAQVGLIMLVGLLGKNAVLIVEFAVQKQQQGLTILQAAIAGAKARFRPILMTSFAFIAGLIPLVVATGPGAIANHTIGASALGGMLFGTVFGVIVVPGLYYIFASMAEGKELIQKEDERPFTEPGYTHAN